MMRTRKASADRLRRGAVVFLTLLFLLAGMIPAFAQEPDLRFYVLSGPTGIGAMNLWEKADAGETRLDVQLTMTGSNDEIIAAISSGSADLAAIATNLAAVLYQKTDGGVSVVAVNTLGVLNLLALSNPPQTMADLKGRTIVAPGQGANPEYILRYVLQGNGLDPDRDIELRFVSEGAELLSVWGTEPEAVLLAPQPVATTLLMQNEGAVLFADMTQEWEAVSGGESTLMMGCVIARNDYLRDHAAEVEIFLAEYEASIAAARNDVPHTAALCEAYGLIPKAALAQKAIPHCGLTFLSGEELQQLSGYYRVMYEAAPKSIGGALPGDDFYYAGK